MIRNVLVLSKEGKGLFAGDFTGSDELGEGAQMMNAIISAVHSFSKMLSEEGASEIRLGDLTVHFASRGNLLFALAVDGESTSYYQAKLLRISGLFLESFQNLLTGIEEIRDTSQFDGFKQLLLDLGIVE
ncbi:MAG: hypothetical protein ACW97A_10035 [Candidatus Thorarchaeota archaeon]